MCELDKVFDAASEQEQIDFIKKRHRILCRLISGEVECTLCFRFEKIAREIMQMPKESLKKES